MYHFALIGCGQVAALHAEAIARMGKLVAVCDIDLRKAEEMASLYGANTYKSLDELLAKENEVEIVSVCTPIGCHAEHAIRSLQAGRHVMCESPLCLTSAGAWQMIETEKYCRRKLYVVDLVMKSTALAGLKEKLLTGEPRSFQFELSTNHPDDHYRGWRGKVFPGGGLLYTDFSDGITALRTLFGRLEEVEGFASNLSHPDTIEFEDAGSVTVRTRKGYQGKLSWSINKDQGNELALQLSDGKERIQIDQVPRKEGYEAVYQRLIHLIEEDQPSNLQEATRTIEAIEKIYKALTPNPA